MDKMEINAKFKELAELKMMEAELKAEIATIEDELKAHMEANNLTELLGDEHKATWKEVASTKFDKEGIIKKLASVTHISASAIKQTYTLSNPSKRFKFA